MLPYKIKKIIFRITPPLLMDFAIYFYKIIKRDKSNYRYFESKESDNIEFKKLYYLTENSVLNIPLNKVRHHGGQAYTYSQNHFMQNGSIYIFKKKLLEKHNNRLGGKIMVYEMDDWQSFQLDSLKQKKVMELLFSKFLKKIYE